FGYARNGKNPSVVFQIFLTSRQSSVGAHSPPSKGGVAAALIRSREATEEPQTGWSLTQHVSETHSETTLVSDHPVRAFSERKHFVNGASTLEASPYRARASRPPLQGGECACPESVADTMWDTTLASRLSHHHRSRAVDLGSSSFERIRNNHN